VLFRSLDDVTMHAILKMRNITYSITISVIDDDNINIIYNNDDSAVFHGTRIVQK